VLERLVTPQQHSVQASVESQDGRTRALPWRTASGIGLVAFTVSMLGSWIPSLWGDEAASIMSAQRSWSSLFRMLGNVDAVHGAYYAFLHLWIDAFGASTVSVRLPSAIAIGLAAAGVVVLANRLGNYRVALIAGIAIAVLPRVTYMGEEARSYALGTALAVWLTILFVRLISRGTTNRWAWLGYALLFTASIFVFLYLVLLAAVYAATLLSYTRDRRLLLRWAGWSALGVALATPVIIYALRQRDQVSFLAHRHGVTLVNFLVTQWFGWDALALAAWLSIAALVAASVVLWWRGRRGAQQLRADAQTDAHRAPLIALRLSGERREPALLILTFAWFVLPPLILFVANTFLAPLYSIRYMSFVTPAVAILLALAIDAVARRQWMAVLAVACLVALAAPSYLTQRTPYAKDGGSDWAQVAAVVGGHAHPNDAIVFDESARPSRDPRLAMHLYPAAFANVVDVRVTTPYQDTSRLWDQTQSIPASAARIAATDGRLWLVEYHGPNGAGVISTIGQTQRLAQLKALGYSVTETFTLHRDAVYLLTKGS
jgi:mannosyltransferase